MSTSSVVPETWQLSGDDARRTLRDTGRLKLAKDAFLRLRFADGFSHARSLAYLLSLVVVQGLVAMVGLGDAVGGTQFAEFMKRFVQGFAGDQAGKAIIDTIQNAENTALSHRYLPLLLGLVGAIISATTAMAQLERSLNRIYGVELDRPFVAKYGRALLLAMTAGVLVTAAVVAIAMGRSIGQSLDNHAIANGWAIARFPLGIAVLIAGIALLFRWSPKRHQPHWSWMAFGSTVSVLGIFVVTLGLTVVLHLSSTFGETYGPLAGMVAVLLWALLAAIVLLYGASFAAQLEAVRAGATPPQDEQKVEESEPGSRVPAAAGRS
jgi:YihY family inner membrane protein